MINPLFVETTVQLCTIVQIQLPVHLARGLFFDVTDSGVSAASRSRSKQVLHQPLMYKRRSTHAEVSRWTLSHARRSLCSFLECRNQLAVLTCKPKSMVNNGSGFYKLTPEQMDKSRSYRTFKFNSNEQIHVYRLLLLFIAPPVQTSWRRHNVCYRFVRLSVRSFVCPLRINLVNTIFWKRMNLFRCKLAQFVCGTRR